MDRKTAELAVLFADIAKSTSMYEELGDKVAQNLISACLSELADVTEKHQGSVIKTIGDEIMCTFPGATSAVEAGIEMHEAAEEVTVDGTPLLEPPNLYIGIHSGQVIMEDGDVFGDTVNIAARITSMAKQRQLLITQDVYNSLIPELKASTKCIDKTTIKGKSGEFNVYETIWEIQDATVIFSGTKDGTIAKGLESSLELISQGQTVVINQNHASASIGRQSHNDLVVGAKSASRSHARIELRRDKFILIDQSSNGTYIYTKEGKVFRLKQDETQLKGNGTLCLGQQVEPDSPDVIHYKVL